MIDNLTPPSELVAAAYEIDTWFKQRGVTTWELGPICSRDHATKLRATVAIFEAALEESQIN